MNSDPAHCCTLYCTGYMGSFLASRGGPLLFYQRNDYIFFPKNSGNSSIPFLCRLQANCFKVLETDIFFREREREANTLFSEFLLLSKNSSLTNKKVILVPHSYLSWKLKQPQKREEGKKISQTSPHLHRPRHTLFRTNQVFLFRERG